MENLAAQRLVDDYYSISATMTWQVTVNRTTVSLTIL